MAWMMEQAYPIFLDVVICVFISLKYFRLSLCGYVYCCFYVIRELSIYNNSNDGFVRLWLLRPILLGVKKL